MKTRLVKPLNISSAVTRCTALDFTAVGSVPRIALAYQTRLDPERLSQTLGQVVSDYSLFSGQLSNKEHLQIERGRRGVPFELTESSETSLGLVEKAEALGSDLVAPRLSVAAAMIRKGPLMAARLTQTADGSVLGFAWNHVIGDFHTVMMMLSAWVNAYRGLPYDAPIELDDRVGFWREHLTPDPAVSSELRMMGLDDQRRLLAALLQGTRRVVVDLEREDLATMHAAVGTQSQVTVEDALWTHLFMALHRLRGKEQPAQLAFAVNVRRRLGLPDAVLGNLTGIAKVDAEPDDDVATLAARLRAAIKGPVASYYPAEATERFAAAHPGRLQRLRYLPVWVDPHRGNFFISSLTRFPYDRLTFVPGAPMLQLYGSLGDSAMSSALGYASATGRQVALWLPRRLARHMAGQAGRARIVDAGTSTRRARTETASTHPSA